MLTGWRGPGQAPEPDLLPARAHLGTRESVWSFCRARERTRLQSGKTGCDALRTHLPHRNKSRRPSQFARESLSEEDRALLRVLRRADFELWDEHCGGARGG